MAVALIMLVDRRTGTRVNRNPALYGAAMVGSEEEVFGRNRELKSPLPVGSVTLLFCPRRPLVPLGGRGAGKRKRLTHFVRSRSSVG